jgi:hypothetical protein
VWLLYTFSSSLIRYFSLGTLSDSDIFLLHQPQKEHSTPRRDVNGARSKVVEEFFILLQFKLRGKLQTLVNGV